MQGGNKEYITICFDHHCLDYRRGPILCFHYYVLIDISICISCSSIL